MNLSNDKFNIINEINVFIPHSAVKRKKEITATVKHLTKMYEDHLGRVQRSHVMQAEIFEMKSDPWNEEDWEHFWAWIMLDFSSP